MTNYSYFCIAVALLLLQYRTDPVKGQFSGDNSTDFNMTTGIAPTTNYSTTPTLDSNHTTSFTEYTKTPNLKSNLTTRITTAPPMHSTNTTKDNASYTEYISTQSLNSGLTTSITTTTTPPIDSNLTTRITTRTTTTLLPSPCASVCNGDGQICANEFSTECECEEGYEVVGGYCVKVCPASCSTNSSCRNAEVGCECIEGFENVTLTCSDINECLKLCQEEGQNCTNHPGYYTCGCDKGYFPVEGGCDKQNPACPTCGENAVCKDPYAGCECTDGWMGDPKACEDVNECLTECQDPTLLCMNTEGSYRCSCIDGYQRNDTGDCSPIRCTENKISVAIAPSNLGVDVVTFPATLAGYSTTSNDACDVGSANAGKSLATRTCSITGSWGSPTWLSSCNQGLEELADTDIQNEEERKEVSSSLEVITSIPETLEIEDVQQATEVIREVINVEKITTQIATSLVSTIGNLAESPSLEESGTTEDMLFLLDTISLKVNLNDEEIYTSVSNNVSVVVMKNLTLLTSSSLGWGIVVLVRPNSTTLGFRGDQLQFVDKDTTAGGLFDGNKIQANIFVPSAVLTTRPTAKDNRTSFFTFGNSNFFLRLNSTKQNDGSDLVNKVAEVDSIVLAATIQGVDVSNLQSGEKIEFSILRGDTDGGRDVCAFWNERVNDWSPQGCEVDVNNADDQVVSCTCDHLTNFATLLDPTSITDIKSLEVITIVGCSISSFGLFLVIVVFIFREDTRKGQKLRAAVLLTSLCTALLGLNICLLVSNIESVENSEVSCRTIALVMHFFLIAACGWMNCEAANLYIAIVKPIYAKNVLRNRTVILFSCLWAWGFPAVFVSALFLSNKDFYEREDICWIAGDMVVFLVLIPVSMQVAFNVAVYVILTVKMWSTSRALKTQRWEEKRSAKWRKFVINVCIFVTVGVTWIFGLLIPVFQNNPTATLAFAYIFTILNSLQGFILFLLYIVRSKEIRRSISKTFSRLSTSLGLSNTTNWSLENHSTSEKKQKVVAKKFAPQQSQSSCCNTVD